MKKTHRKDVIVARIIFACILLIFVAAISGGVVYFIKTHDFSSRLAEEYKNKNKETQETQYVPEIVEPTTEKVNSEAPTQIIMKTTANVNLRETPSVTGKKLTLLKPGEEVVKIGEEAGFIKVKYGEIIGYVFKDYVTEKKQENNN